MSRVSARTLSRAYASDILAEASLAGLAPLDAAAIFARASRAVQIGLDAYAKIAQASLAEKSGAMQPLTAPEQIDLRAIVKAIKSDQVKRQLRDLLNAELGEGDPENPTATDRTRAPRRATVSTGAENA